MAKEWEMVSYTPTFLKHSRGGVMELFTTAERSVIMIQIRESTFCNSSSKAGKRYSLESAFAMVNGGYVNC